MSVKINGIEFGNELFPNNERIFKSLPWQICAQNFIRVDFKYETDFDIWKLIVAKKYLDDKFNGTVIVLNMLYVPYSRMDREIEGYTFSLKYFCDLINSLNFHQVKVLDTHSNVTEALINHLYKINVQDFVDKVIEKENSNYVFYPDSGALKRYSETIKLPENIGIFYGNKQRDLSTGKILKFELINCPEDIKDKNVLIVDDLCSKGGTFIASAELIKNAGAKRVCLYVSHCEDSIIDGKILKTDFIDIVYTSNSINRSGSSEKIYEFCI